jgi:hypothetical protein
VWCSSPQSIRFSIGCRRTAAILSVTWTISDRRRHSQIRHQAHEPFVLVILMMTMEQSRAWIVGDEIDLDSSAALMWTLRMLAKT